MANRRRSDGVRWAEMQIGQSVVIPVVDKKEANYWRQRAFRAGNRLGRYFSVYKCDSGIRITREPLDPPEIYPIIPEGSAS